MQPIIATTPLGATTHRLQKHQWEAVPTTKYGECSGFLQSLYKIHHGFHVTPNQTAEDSLLDFYGRDTSWSLEHSAKLLSNLGTNFESNVIKELCELMGIQES